MNIANVQPLNLQSEQEGEMKYHATLFFNSLLPFKNRPGSSYPGFLMHENTNNHQFYKFV